MNYATPSFAWCVATALMFVAETAAAQAVHGCPAGQAIQSSDPSGKSVTCIAVPPPVDVSGLQGMDALLLQAIADEAQARKAADGELRGQISEASVVGRYSYTGTQYCIGSSLGFNPADLTPNTPPLWTPPAPLVSNIVSIAATSTWGSRTFNADGTGTVETFGLSVGAPSFFYNSTGFGLNATPPNASGVRGPSGNVTTFHLTGDFAWRIEGDKLIVEDATPKGPITSPGPRFGWTTYAKDVPPLVATLGKDLKVISLVQQSAAVESVVNQNPNDPSQVFETPRICSRERLLTKQ